MKLVGILFGLVTLFSSSAFANTSEKVAEKAWGAKIDQKVAVSLDEAIKTFPHNGEILVEGKALQVCQKKGCWLTLGSKSSDVRVTFKGYKFFVPFSLKDQAVKVQGVLKEETVSVADQKHYLQDEGRPQAEIDAVKEPKKTFAFVASGVEKI
jgi:hypothetical protein